ncbi:MAG: hypothetical protein R8M46_00525 [Ghiorsea sp.]
MSHSPHQLLSQVSEHKRDAEGDILQQLTTYRVRLVKIIKTSETECTMLRKQREIKMDQGTDATELMMLEQSLNEHVQQIHEVSCEIETLDVAITQQRKKWAEQHKKHKAHEKMHHEITTKEKRTANQKLQKSLDDQFSSKVFAKSRV